MNKAIIRGFLGRDPEARSTPSGQTLAKYSVATTRKWKDRDGNRQEQTEWHNIIAWGRAAEVVAQYLQKGSHVIVTGRLQTDSWEDKETGKKMYRTEIVQEEMEMLPDGKRGGDGSRGSSNERDDYDDGGSHDGYGDDDDDIPF